MCEERLRLLAAYDHAVDDYAVLASNLRIAANGSAAEFRIAMERTEEALEDLRNARLAFQIHQQIHGCWTVSAPFSYPLMHP